MKKNLLTLSGLLFLIQVAAAQHLVPFNCASNKWGYVNQSNILIINCQYTYAGTFRNGYAEVAKDGKWGVIDSTGKVVIPLEYQSIKSFCKGTAVYEDVLSGRYGITSADGKVTLPLGKLRFIGAFNQGFSVIEQTGGKRGVIDYRGNLIIPVKYDGVWIYNDGFASVKLNDKYGIVDRKGQVIVPVKYESVNDFSEGLASVETGDKYGYVNKKGKIVIPLIWDFAGKFSGGLAPVKKNGLYGFINKEGETVVPCKYTALDKYTEGYSNSRATIVVDGKFGAIDQNGIEVIPPIYDSFERFSDSLALVVKEGKKFFIDVEGNVRISPDYDEVTSFKEGLSVVKKDGKYGFIGIDGTEVFPCQFDEVRWLEDGLRYVKMKRYPNDIIGYIDTKGKPFYYSVEELKKIEEERLALLKKMQVDTRDMAKYVSFGYKDFLLGFEGVKELYKDMKSPGNIFNLTKLSPDLVQIDIKIKAYKGGVENLQNLNEITLKCPMHLSYGLVSESGFTSEGNPALKAIILTSAAPEGSDAIFETIKGCFIPWEDRLYLRGYIRSETGERYFEIIGNIDPSKPYEAVDKSIFQMIFDLYKN